jgi:hypothetical protein
VLDTLRQDWRTEGVDAWSRRHPRWGDLPWLLAMTGAGVSAMVALLVSGGSGTALFSGLNAWCVVGLWPFLCYCGCGSPHGARRYATRRRLERSRDPRARYSTFESRDELIEASGTQLDAALEQFG